MAHYRWNFLSLLFLPAVEMSGILLNDVTTDASTNANLTHLFLLPQKRPTARSTINDVVFFKLQLSIITHYSNLDSHKHNTNQQ
jgi:hypothetical protein